MKTTLNLFKTKTLLLGFFIAALFYIPACDITDPTEGVTAVLNTKARTTTVSVIFRDSATGEPVGFTDGTNVSVNVTGPDADKVIDLLNRSKTSFEAAKGFLSFAVADELAPGEDNPLEFNIVASANGFITTSTPVSIAEIDNTPIEVNMVNLSNRPRGVTGETGRNVGVASSNGRITTTETFGTTPDPTTNTRATFVINQNTLIRDANGNNLQGELTADFNQFNSRDTESLQSFPGGFSARVENNPTGEENVFFTTGGFTSLTITDESGRRARTFDPPIEINIELDSEVRDHENNPVSAGSQVPIWSYNDETGTWAFEQNATVAQGSSNNLEVQFNADHLSWWNIDWYGNSCYYGTRVNLNGNNSNIRGKLLRADNGNFLGWAASRNVSGSSNFIQFLNAPRDVAGVLELYDMSNNLLETVDLPDMCSSTPVDVDLGNNPQITVTFRGVGVCPNRDDIEVRPSFPAFYKPASGGSWLSAGSVVNGELSITLPSPGSYAFGAYYEDTFYQYTLDLSDATDGDLFEEVVDLPSDVCSEL